MKHDSPEGLDGDFDLEAIRPIRAFQLRILTFDVWRDFSGRALTATSLSPQFDDEGVWNDYDPRWSDPLDRDRYMAVSIAWVANVLYPDGTLASYDASTVLEAVEALGGEVSAEDLMPRREPPQ